MWRITVLSFFLVAMLTACRVESSEETRAAEGADSGADGSEATAVAPTEYVTSVQFLPMESSSASALILQFSNTATRDGLNHRYLGWLLGRSGWRSVLDADFSGETTRAPWRLFPADSLRLVVTADGDPDALIFQARSASYVLDLGTHLDAWEDRAGTRYDIHAAQWTQGGRTVSGVAVEHRFAISGSERPARFGSFDRALLKSEDDALIVLFHSRSPELYGDSFAWMYADGLTRRWTALEARTVEVASSSQLRRNVPIRFSFQIPEPDIRGELTVAARLLNEFAVEEGPKPYNALYQVRGWMEFGGERRRLEGLLERGEP